jgi:hypothetical protein
MSTITWEGVREGIYDARYTATLRRLIAQARGSVHQDLAVSAQQTLDKILGDVPPAPGTLPQDGLDALRAQIASLIMRFIEAGITPDVPGHDHVHMSH